MEWVLGVGVVLNLLRGMDQHGQPFFVVLLVEFIRQTERSDLDK